MRFSAPLFVVASLLILVASCGSAAKLAAIQEGTASWYGPGFHGKKTASGETYDQNAFTAAHKTLPIGTIVRVVNTRNKKAVNVRINDRGPYVSGRIIDLSKAAAVRLGMLQTGTAPVRLFVPENAHTGKLAGKADSNEQFSVQLASYSVKSQADAKAAGTPDGWVSVSTSDGKTVYRVMSGKFTTKSDAEKHKRALEKKGRNGFVKQVE